MAGTTTATLFVKPRWSANLSANGRSGAVLFVPLRLLAGIYQAQGIVPARNTRNLKKTLPHSSVPVGSFTGSDGKTVQVQINQFWYAFFYDVINRILGGPNGSTLPDVISSVSIVQNQGANVATQQAALTQMAVSNAATAAAAVQVVQQAALPGATQIPAAVTSVPEVAAVHGSLNVSHQTE